MKGTEIKKDTERRLPGGWRSKAEMGLQDS